MRSAYVPQWVRQLLVNLPTRFQQEWIFLNSFDDPVLDADIFNADWGNVLRKAKFEYRVPYTCRHTRAAELLSMGVEPGKAAKALGHTLEMFYRTYAEWIDEYSNTNLDKEHAKLEGVRPSSE